MPQTKLLAFRSVDDRGRVVWHISLRIDHRIYRTIDREPENSHHPYKPKAPCTPWDTQLTPKRKSPTQPKPFSTIRSPLQKQP